MGELVSKLVDFPNQKHVQTVCKPGQGAATCRFLSMMPDGVYKCEKFASLGRYLNYRAESGDLTAQGDNCEGVLGLIAENQEELMGNRIIHTEDGEDTQSVFDGVRSKGGYKGSLGVGDFGYAQEFTTISLEKRGIVFTAPFGERAVVTFKKANEQPQQPAE